MGRRVTQGALAVVVGLALAGTVANAAQPADAGVNAIIGGDLSAIIGGDTQAIIGGDRTKTKRSTRSDAIIGGDFTSARSALVVGLDPYSVFSRDAIVAGPLLRDGRAVSMLGRSFKLRPDMLSLIESDVDSGQAAAIVFRGAAGSRLTGAPRMIITREAYVDGVSQVLVTGKVSRVNAHNGSVQVGKVTVDYSQLLARGPVELAVNDQIAVIGVRPSRLSAIQATGLSLERASE